MKNVLAFNGSIRKSGNTAILLKRFLDGAKANTKYIDSVYTHELNLEYCRGCLRCNLVGHCTLHNDVWNQLSEKILDADVLVFATPVYFHHVTAPMKRLLDRFRSFVKVLITESELEYLPWHKWKKDFVLILTMGSSNALEAAPVIDLFNFFKTVLGQENRLHIITATRLAVINHLIKTKEELVELYDKMSLPPYLVNEDLNKNRELMDQAYKLGRTITIKE
jgi:multimeric flavodoxin WrbA